MREHSVNKLNNFIGGWYLDDTSICDELIEFSNTHPRTAGVVVDKNRQQIDKDVKDSLDVMLTAAPEELFKKYVWDNLQLVVEEYIKKYNYCNVHSPWRIILQVVDINTGIQKEVVLGNLLCQDI